MHARAGMPSSRRGGLLLKLMFFLVMLGLFATAAWWALLPSILVSTIRARTGFAVKIEELSANPFTGHVELSGLVIQNPDGWPEPAFVELRRLRAEMSFFSLFTDQFVADELSVDIAHVTLVRNAQGMLNAVAFHDGLFGTEKPAATAKKQTFLIRHLVLKFDRLTYADYSGRRPARTDYSLSLQRDLHGVDGFTKIISPLTGSALSLVTNALGGMFKGRPDLLPPGPADSLRDAGKRTGEALKGLMDSLDKKRP